MRKIEVNLRSEDKSRLAFTCVNIPKEFQKDLVSLLHIYKDHVAWNYNGMPSLD